LEQPERWRSIDNELQLICNADWKLFVDIALWRISTRIGVKYDLAKRMLVARHERYHDRRLGGKLGPISFYFRYVNNREVEDLAKVGFPPRPKSSDLHHQSPPDPYFELWLEREYKPKRSKKITQETKRPLLAIDIGGIEIGIDAKAKDKRCVAFRYRFEPAKSIVPTSAEVHEEDERMLSSLLSAGFPAFIFLFWLYNTPWGQRHVTLTLHPLHFAIGASVVGLSRTIAFLSNVFLGIGALFLICAGFATQTNWQLSGVSVCKLLVVSGILCVLYGAFPAVFAAALYSAGVFFVMLTVSVWRDYRNHKFDGDVSIAIAASCVFIAIATLCILAGRHFGKRYERISQNGIWRWSKRRR
jgi:hypothetical protein